MKDSIEKDQRIISELGRYRLAPPSADLQCRVLRAAREALSGSGAGLNWTGRWLRACGAFRQQFLAFASSLMLILGVAMQLWGGQSALANSLKRLTVMASISGSLQRATSMDCTVMKADTENEISQYRIRWNTTGVTRIDRDSTGNTEQTLWITGAAVSVPDEGNTVLSTVITAVPSDWKPPLEFMTPTTLARHIDQYGIMQTEHQGVTGKDEFLLVGQKDQQIIEMTIDAGTYLPKTQKKYLLDSARGRERICLEDVRFQWNKPIPQELLVPGMPAVQQRVN